MIDLFCLFTPCMVSIMWALLFAMRKLDKKLRLVFIMSIMLAIYFFVDAHYYYAKADIQTLAELEIISSTLILAIPPMFATYLHCFVSRVHFQKAQLLLFLPAIFYGIALSEQHARLGIDNIVTFLNAYYATGEMKISSVNADFRYYIFVWNDLFISFILVEMGALMVYLAWLMTRVKFSFKRMYCFFFKGGTSRTTVMTSTLAFLLIAVLAYRILIGSIYLRENQFTACVVSLIISIILFLIFYLGYLDEKKEPTLRSLLNFDLQNP